MLTFDCAIIGGGPAGLAAALAASRQIRKIVIFDSMDYRNLAASHMHNVIGFDHVPPIEMRKKVLGDLERHYGSDMVQLVREKIVSVKETRIGDQDTGKPGFELTDDQGTIWRARKVILATGSRDLLPNDIPGFSEAWGNHIFHCLFCHGYEERGSEHSGSLIILSPLKQPMIEHLAINIAMAARLSRTHTVFTNGMKQEDLDLLKRHPLLASMQAKGALTTEAFDNRRIASMRVTEDDRLELTFAAGEGTQSSPEALVRFLACPVGATLSHSSKNFASMLDVELSESGNEIKTVSPFGETTRRGVFVAGDIATPLKAASMGVANGAAAGVGAVRQLVEDDYA